MSPRLSDTTLANNATRTLIKYITDACLEQYPEKVERDLSTDKLNFIDLELRKELHRSEEVFRDAIYNCLLYNNSVFLSRCFGRPNPELRQHLKSAGITGYYLPDNMSIKVIQSSVTVTINGKELFKGSL